MNQPLAAVVRALVRMFAAVTVLSAIALGQGSDWEHIQGGKFGRVFFLDSLRGWLTADSHIKYTLDGGETWQEAVLDKINDNEDMRVDYRGVFLVEDPFTLEIKGWAVGDGGVVLRAVSGFGGTRWEDYNNPNDLTNPGSRVEDACGNPGRLYDIHMFEVGDYTNGWAVGEDGAIATTSDGGKNWTNVGGTVSLFFSCNNGAEDIADDAYEVHFFANDPSKGIIISEYRRVYTTNPSGGWDQIDIVQDAPTTPCPFIEDVGVHDKNYNNLELWGLDFDDPANPESPGYVVGGIGNNKGYLYRTSGMNPTTESWAGTWEQLADYNFPDPAGLNICGPSSQYDTVVLSAGRPLSVGYSSQILDYTSAIPNFDACTCSEITNGSLTDAWVEQPLPTFIKGEPLFRTIEKITSSRYCAAGGFGRIVIHDSTANPQTYDVGSTWPRRPNDGAFIDGTSTGAVFGQLLDINYTVDGGETWAAATKDWNLDDSHSGRAIAFNTSGTQGIAVGDLLGFPFDEPFLGEGFIARSTGVPSNWQMVQAPAGARDLHDVTFAASACGQPETAFAVGENGVVIRSVDGGASWDTRSIPDPNVTLYGTSFATPCKGYVAGEGSVVYSTDDGGLNWWQSTVVSPAARIRDIATWGDGSNAIAVGDDGGVWTGGPRFTRIDWQALGLDVTEHLYDVEVVDDGEHVWISGDGGVLLHRDENLVWSKPASGTTIIIPKVDFPTSTTGYAVGGTFTILKYD